MIFIVLVGIAFVWLLRNLRARRVARSENRIQRILVELEEAAARASRQRRISETPLAWLRRLESMAAGAHERTALQQFSQGYEEGAYRDSSADDAQFARLKTLKRQIQSTWRRSRKEVPGRA